MNDCVILREIPTACGRRFGHATLDAPQRLNALSLEMGSPQNSEKIVR